MLFILSLIFSSQLFALPVIGLDLDANYSLCTYVVNQAGMPEKPSDAQLFETEMSQHFPGFKNMGIRFWDLVVGVRGFNANEVSASRSPEARLSYQTCTKQLELQKNNSFLRHEQKGGLARRTQQAATAVLSIDPECTVTEVPCKDIDPLFESKIHDILPVISLLSGIDLKLSEFEHAKRKDLKLDERPVKTRFSEEECRCREDKLKAQTPPGLLKDQEEKQKTSLENFFLGVVGQELIADFSMNLEDVNYYQRNDFTVFKPNALASASKEGLRLQCNDPVVIQENINNKCKTTGIALDIQKERINILFNALGEKTPLSLEEHLASLTAKILTTKSEKNGETFTRDDYDNYRRTQSSTPHVRFMDHVLAKFLKEPDFLTRVDKKLKDSNKSLAQALSLVVSEKFSSDKEGFIKKFSPEDASYKSVIESLERTTSDSLGIFFYNQIKWSGRHNPAFKIAVSNREVLEHLSKNINTRSPSIIDSLEKGRALGHIFDDRCRGFVTKLSEAVCSPQDKLLSGVNKDALSKLVQPGQDGLSTNRVLIDHLICKMDSSKENNPLGGMLRSPLNDPLLNSDFASGTESAFVAASDQAEMVKEIGNKSSSRRRLSSTRRAMAEALAGSVGEEKIIKQNQFQIPEIAPLQTPRFEEAKYFTPTWIPSRPIDNSPAAQTKREELVKNSATAGVPQKVIRDHLNAMTESQLDELKRIREQISRDREMTSKLMEDNFKLKEQNLSRLKQDLELMKALKEAPSGTKVGIPGELQPLPSASSSTPRLGSMARVSDSMVQPQASGGVVGGSMGSTVAENLAAVKGPMPAGNNLRSDITKGDTLSVSSSTSSILVLNAQSVRKNADIPSEEMSRELINYLNQNMLDLNTLTQIKENGMLLRFRVIEGDQLIEKLIPFNELTETAKELIKRRIELHSLPSERLDQEMLSAQRTHSMMAMEYIFQSVVRPPTEHQ
jgi:hypothetical protein